MTNPTRDQILAAHRALAHLCNAASDGLFISEQAAHSIKDQVLDALPPVPCPTMADVEWNDELHYLAEAEQNIHGQVIMLGLDESGMIEYFVPRLRECRYDAAYRETLTPTGRRCILTEVQE